MTKEQAEKFISSLTEDEFDILQRKADESELSPLEYVIHALKEPDPNERLNLFTLDDEDSENQYEDIEYFGDNRIWQDY